MGHRVLVVSGERDRAVLGELLRMHGFDVVGVAPVDLARRAVEWPPDVVIADVASPDVDGAAVVGTVAGLSPTPRTILVSPRPCRARQLNGVVCLTKPIDIDELLASAAVARVAA